MSRKDNLHRNMQNFKAPSTSTSKKKSMAFSFGDPESVLATNITDYLGVFKDNNDVYYTPPVSLVGLAKLESVNAHHGSALAIKKNSIIRFYEDNDIFPLEEMEKAAIEYGMFGQFYLQAYTNRLGKLLRLTTLPGLNMRRMIAPNTYCMIKPDRTYTAFKKGEVVHCKRYCVRQQIYGVPDYMGGIQSALLNESATLFRRRYYENGSHSGFVFYCGAALEDEDAKTLQHKIQESKGVGNFKNLFVNLPGGKKDDVQILPVGDIATKDEFERIKNISRNDVISMHRIQPALAGIMPENTVGFGDIEKIMRVDYENEVVPRQLPFKCLNKLFTGNPIQFKEPGFISP
ncbi:phage portal protein [Dasania marina]|uniref:phage portal protein n=1 Tax=Dasania marina TaxID=471499 RepID=UPI00036952F8|nr:phage portal protein [Dasania marina]